jgi:hypothetical protein
VCRRNNNIDAKGTHVWPHNRTNFKYSPTQMWPANRTSFSYRLHDWKFQSLTLNKSTQNHISKYSLQFFTATCRHRHFLILIIKLH